MATLIAVRIAVLADTHNRLPPHVLAAVAEASEIWHLGDVCNEAVEAQLAATGCPLRIVQGNCDANPNWPERLEFTRAGFRVLLIHVPPRRPPANVDLLFHGHTHVPRDEFVGPTHYYNPGCITRPNRGAPASFAWLELLEGEKPRWTLQLV